MKKVIVLSTVILLIMYGCKKNKPDEPKPRPYVPPAHYAKVYVPTLDSLLALLDDPKWDDSLFCERKVGIWVDQDHYITDSTVFFGGFYVLDIELCIKRNIWHVSGLNIEGKDWVQRFGLYIGVEPIKGTINFIDSKKQVVYTAPCGGTGVVNQTPEGEEFYPFSEIFFVLE